MKGLLEKFIMDKFAIQRRIFTVVAVLMLLSVASLIAVIPIILLDTSPGSLPLQAASGALIGMGIHLYLAYWFGIRLRRRRRKINKEVYILSALGFFFLGFMIMDGAFAFLDDLLFVSIGMFICVFGDFAAALVSIFALIFLKTKTKS
jgi:peptidoglycan/LPS O-acetylase OafA/YrhL